MGVIFRNGIPYGVSQSDVTTVDTIADLDNIENPKEEHIYVVKAVNQPYRYDSTEEKFYPLSAELPTINARNNAIITGDGNSWAKSNISSFEVQSTETDNLIATRYTNKGAVFGTFITDGQTINLINGFRSKDSSLIDMSGSAKIYMDGDTRLAIHDNAWMDVTGTGTQVKVNSGSKVYIDSQYGPNNLMMHGAWIAINDSKSYAFSKPRYYATMKKGEYEEPPTDYETIKNLVYLRSVNLNKSTHYTYAEGEQNALNACRSCSSVEELDYDFEFLFYDGTQTISGVTYYKYFITFSKYDKNYTETLSDTYEAYGYDWGEWPFESYDVPRINISGAPHIQIKDKTYVNIETGSHIDFYNHGKARILNGSTIYSDNAWVYLDGNSSNSIAPAIMLQQNASTGDAKQQQITLGFTDTLPDTYSISFSPKFHSLLSLPDENEYNVTWKSQNDIGPYANFHIMTPTFSNSLYMSSWLNGAPNSVARKNMLPLLHIAGKTYFRIDHSGEYIYEPQIENDGRMQITPRINTGAHYVVSPHVGGNAEFSLMYGGNSNSKTAIRLMPDSYATVNIVADPDEYSNTYIHYQLGDHSNFMLHVNSAPSSNIMYKISTSNGYTWLNGIAQNKNKDNIVTNITEGIDTYSLQAAYSHKETMDYSRFIMRGENIYYNTPATWFLYDCTQDYVDSTGSDGRIPDNKLHLQHGWDRPISNDSDNFKNEKSPTFQMYECSNLILRGWWNYPTQSVTIPTDAYASLSAPQEISLTELKSHPTEWAYFLSQFTDNNKEFIGLVPRSTIVATSQSITVTRARYQYTSAYANAKVNKYHPNAGLDTFGKRSSLIEITDNSELRMWDGICIYARYNPETNEPGIEIVNRFDKNGTDGSGAAGELDRVEFTFEELKYLKRFIGTIPSRLANDTSGMTEPDTLYFLPVGGGGGGGGEELPNATSEDF